MHYLHKKGAVAKRYAPFSRPRQATPMPTHENSGFMWIKPEAKAELRLKTQKMWRTILFCKKLSGEFFE